LQRLGPEEDDDGMMPDETQLRDKLRKIEALFAGAGTAGERDAAEAALHRVRDRLAEMGRPRQHNTDAPVDWFVTALHTCTNHNTTS
jgi:hypothetical protein